MDSSSPSSHPPGLSGASVTSDTSSAQPPPPKRAKRRQVSRACDWCRQHRIKCDTSVPCANCKTRGGHCSSEDALNATSLPEAHREIDRLRRQVAQLEQELNAARLASRHAGPYTAASAGSVSEASPYSDGPESTAATPTGTATTHITVPPSIMPFPSDALLPPSATPRDIASRVATDTGIAHAFWGGVHVGTARSPNKTWYGPSSLFYFISRTAAYLDDSFQFQHPDGGDNSSGHANHKSNKASIDNLLDVNPAGMLVDGPAPPSSSTSTARTRPTDAQKQAQAHVHDSTSRPHASIQDALAGARFLTLTQEEYFLDLYWHSYHAALFPVLDEADFRQHYRSLWATSGQDRAPSALVDIVLALCLQIGVSTMVPGMRQKLIVDNDDTSVAGRWYYRRCQALLEYELESPSLSTLQCHILCGVYLCNGTFQNMSDSSCALAVREAHMLGLHLAPPADMTVRQSELRIRIWWALYVLDSKIGMKLGRPFLLHLAGATTPPQPDDSVAVAALSGSSFAPLGDNRSWLSFHLYHSALFQVARAAHVAFYSGNQTPLPVRPGQTLWDHPEALEVHARIALTHGDAFAQWARSVPPALTTARVGGGARAGGDGRPFSTDGSPLDIEPFAPLWVQRQRLLLELMYHNLCINLYRPLISFETSAFSAAPVRQCADACAHHAITLTQIVHQVLSTTSILAGWSEVFQWQWNAAMTLVGFLLAMHEQTRGIHRSDDICEVPIVCKAHAAVELAIAVFDMFGRNFAVATSAAAVIRTLRDKVNYLAQQNARAQRQQAQAQAQGHAGQAAIQAEASPVCVQSQPVAMNGAALPPANGIPDLLNTGPDKQPEVTFSGLDASVLQDTMLMAFDVDQWLDLNALWPDSEGVLFSM
ncbi:hypothetical protein HMPREF1624_04207 [Sporothrix schenckii ATCC 58251]|uniref:Zn(2)-C6 fungal-type domain-containing protein n=1 Tax=Sporothrix schenckii (strain ATCC 58251 / de Perez 2211183) TaxID=1391915 RepID=U7PTV0_SPOS1|nr:hypothetical protein HMPREF1624_04207 [Sporothrix schenckii ATCC 58251]